MARAAAWSRARLRGVLVAFAVAIAARFLGAHYHAPEMLFALLIGMSLHFLHERPSIRTGVDFTSSRLLKIGVALLGVRVTFSQIAELGAEILLIIPALIVATIASGVVLSKALGKSRAFGVLSGGAVAICGASAALAISSVLPRSPAMERDTLFTVVAVTTLSTAAMIFYPLVFNLVGAGDTEIGFLIGATIHDVAQVVGAGYAVSEQTGDFATVVKLLRVACLPVVVIALAAMFRSETGAAPFPWFAAGFAALLAVNSLGLIPDAVRELLGATARWLLVAAISALGVKTSLKAIAELGPGHILLVVSETVFLLLTALAMVWLR